MVGMVLALVSIFLMAIEDSPEETHTEILTNKINE
jgi:hypothetical protein